MTHLRQIVLRLIPPTVPQRRYVQNWWQVGKPVDDIVFPGTAIWGCTKVLSGYGHRNLGHPCKVPPSIAVSESTVCTGQCLIHWMDGTGTASHHFRTVLTIMTPTSTVTPQTLLASKNTCSNDFNCVSLPVSDPSTCWYSLRTQHPKLGDDSHLQACMREQYFHACVKYYLHCLNRSGCLIGVQLFKAGSIGLATAKPSHQDLPHIS